MPLYEFVCGKCGYGFEALIRGPDEAAGLACPKCRQRQLVKQFSTFGLGGGEKGGDGSARNSRASSGCATCRSGTCATCH